VVLELDLIKRRIGLEKIVR